MKETELIEGHDLYDYMPERLNNGFKYFEKFIRADDEVMAIGPDGLVDPAVRGLDNDQPYRLWPHLIKKLLAADGRGVSYDEIGLRKLDRPQSYARWEDFHAPLKSLPSPCSTRTMATTVVPMTPYNYLWRAMMDRQTLSIWRIKNSWRRWKSP